MANTSVNATIVDLIQPQPRYLDLCGLVSCTSRPQALQGTLISSLLIGVSTARTLDETSSTEAIEAKIHGHEAHYAAPESEHRMKQTR